LGFTIQQPVFHPIIFYSTVNNRWQIGGADATNVIIPPEYGLIITRKQATPVAFTLQGSVKVGTSGFI